ncbi:MAG: hypothetical protein DRH04_09090, partial [Deltaproteobacteria bacterium]
MAFNMQHAWDCSIHNFPDRTTIAPVICTCGLNQYLTRVALMEKALAYIANGCPVFKAPKVARKVLKGEDYE